MARLAGIAIIALLLVAATSSPKEQISKAADHQNAASAVQPAAATTPIKTPAPRLPSADNQTQTSTDQSWNCSDAIAPTTWSTWALAILGGIAAWVGLRSLSEINEQSKIANRALAATERAARAGEISAETQRKAMLTVERPHLLFESPKLFQFSPEPRKDSDPPLQFDEVKRRVEAATYPSVTYQVKNYGNSPAWLRRWSVIFKSIDQLPETPIYEEQPVIGFAIPAGQAFPQETMLRPVGLSYEQRLRILKNEERLFIYGFIEYTDIFKEEPHRTGFCWRWTGPSGFFGPAGIWEPSGPESYWFYE